MNRLGRYLMNRLGRLIVVVLVLGLLPLVSGCPGEIVRSNHNFALPLGEERSFIVDARPKNRKISVNVSSDTPVKVIVTYGPDEATADRLAFKGKPPEHQVKEKVTEDTIEVDLPANQLLRVAVASTVDTKTTANVQLKIKGK